MKTLELQHIKKAYFIGIGGIGMSALARYLNDQGIEIHGYDLTRTPLTETLEEEGMIIHYDETINRIPKGVDLVVYTPAVPNEHVELTWFRTNNYPVLKRAEVLGIISRERRTIAVAGTHGKTTTSSMLTHILRTGGLECTAFLGGIAGNFASNYVKGTSDWVVVEADEFDRSFLQLDPDIAVVLAMDPDHLDIYGTPEAMHEGFKDFVKKVKPGGRVFLKYGLADNFHESELNALKNLKSYGLENGDFRSTNIHVKNGGFYFDYHSDQGVWKDLMLALPGQHNVENATVATAVAQQLGISEKAVREALKTFKGIKRRFDQVTNNQGVVFIDDYAHHPEELRAAIKAARTLHPDKKLTGIFQPHLFSRTRDFVDGFAAELDLLDEPILIEIYPARELPIEGVTSKIIFDKMKNPNKRLTTKAAVKELFTDKENLKQLEVLLTLGAGNIDTLVPVFEKAINDL